MTLNKKIVKELEQFLAEYGQSLGKFAQYPPGMTDEYEKARHYVLWHSCNYGLGYECLDWFYKYEKETPGDPWRSANDALSEWDI